MPALERAIDSDASPSGQGGYSYASSQPPLYYALTAVAYRVSPDTDLLSRVHAMRLVSALLAAITVLLVFLFVRELLPGTAWAWTLGALAVALLPVFGNVSGGVNDDNLLFTAAAGAFLGLAASFRRGLTVGLGALIGASAAVGVLAKFTMLGLLPGLGIGLLLLVWTASPENRPAAIRGLITAVAVAAIPVGVYMVLNSAVWDRGLYFASSSGGKPAPTGGAIGAHSGFLGHLWQFYLPRLPFMTDEFTQYPLIHVWFEGFVGRFGGGDYSLPHVVDFFAAAVYAFVAVLFVRGLASARDALRRRAELARMSRPRSSFCSSCTTPATSARRTSGGRSSRRATCSRCSPSTED